MNRTRGTWHLLSVVREDDLGGLVSRPSFFTRVGKEFNDRKRYKNESKCQSSSRVLRARNTSSRGRRRIEKIAQARGRRDPSVILVRLCSLPPSSLISAEPSSRSKESAIQRIEKESLCAGFPIIVIIIVVVVEPTGFVRAVETRGG